jgi:hypothetical protein
VEALTKTVQLKQRLRFVLPKKRQSILGWLVMLFVAIGALFLFFATMIFGTIFMGIFTDQRQTEIEQWEVSSGFPKEAQKYLQIYMEAGKKYGVPWHILAAIHKIETNFGQDLRVSPVGARGHTQVRP